MERESELGQSLVEFTIIAGILLIAIFGVISYAIYYHAENVVQGAARVGARAAATAGAGPNVGTNAANSYLDALAPGLVGGRSVTVVGFGPVGDGDR